MSENDRITLIRQQLANVQGRIAENKKLQSKFPKQRRGLEITLSTLKHLESDMITALQEELSFNTFEVYQLRFAGPKTNNQSISLNDFGELLIGQQGLVTTFASEKTLGKNAQIESDIVLDSQMDLIAVAPGSIKVIVSNSQKVLCDVEKAETPIKHAFNDLKKIIDCGNEEELLKAEENRLGPKKIVAYKKFLKMLYEKDLDMEISSRSNRQDVPIINIDSKSAKSTYDILIKNEKPHEDELVLTGVIRGYDLDKGKFRFVVEEGKKSKNVYGKFNPNLEDKVVKNANKLVKVNLSRIKERKGIGERESKNHELLNFIEDN